MNKIAWTKTSKEWISLNNELKKRLCITIEDDAEFWSNNYFFSL